jgi:hypothetical protein
MGGSVRRWGDLRGPTDRVDGFHVVMSFVENIFQISSSLFYLSVLMTSCSALSLVLIMLLPVN